MKKDVPMHAKEEATVCVGVHTCIKSRPKGMILLDL